MALPSFTDDFDVLLENYQSFFAKFDMDKQNILEVYEDWKESSEDTVVKYFWAILEKLLYEAYNQLEGLETRYQILSLILKEMRNYKLKYEGDKANDLHKRYLFCKLKEYEQKVKDQESLVTLVTCQCCAYCGTLEGKQVTLEEALANQFLPEDRCKNELGCNCFYRFPPKHI